MRSRIILKKITIRDLVSFAGMVGSPSHERSIAPISRIRALAHAKNPCASPDDAALLVAYHNNHCAGYYGLLPGYLFIDGNYSKVYWSSTFYVAEPLRGGGVGQELVRGIIALNQDILVCGVSPRAKQILRMCGYHEIEAQTHWQLRIDRVKNLLPESETLSSLPPLQQSETKKSTEVDMEFQLYQYQKRHFYQKIFDNIPKHSNDIRYQTVCQLEDFPRPEKHEQPCFYRGVEVMNWMLKYKWMCSKDEISDTMPDAEVSDYYFTTVKDIHQYYSYEFHSKDDNLYLGFLIFSVSRRRGETVIKILDHTFSCRDAAWSACRLTLHSARKYLADRIDVPIDLVKYFESLELLVPLIKRQLRTIFYHPKRENSVLGNNINRIRFDYCDGDGPFI